MSRGHFYYHQYQIQEDEILRNLLFDLGIKEIVEVYKSFDKWLHIVNDPKISTKQ